MTKRTRNEHLVQKQNQNANTKDPGRIYMAVVPTFCAQNLRPRRQLARVLVLLVGNTYDAVIFSHVGYHSDFFMVVMTKKQGKQIRHDKCDGNPWK